MGVFLRMMEGLSAEGADSKTVMIDASYLKARCATSSLRVKKRINPCIPWRKSRLGPIKCDKRRYKRRNRIETMFARLKDSRRVATRYDRCLTAFFSVIALAATVIFWL